MFQNKRIKKKAYVIFNALSILVVTSFLLLTSIQFNPKVISVLADDEKTHETDDKTQNDTDEDKKDDDTDIEKDEDQKDEDDEEIDNEQDEADIDIQDQRDVF